VYRLLAGAVKVKRASAEVIAKRSLIGRSRRPRGPGAQRQANKSASTQQTPVRLMVHLISRLSPADECILIEFR
jgi:hypothetical protein